MSFGDVRAFLGGQDAQDGLGAMDAFDTTSYVPISAATGSVGERLGAHIDLEFTADDLVEGTKIGTIQSVKALKWGV